MPLTLRTSSTLLATAYSCPIESGTTFSACVKRVQVEREGESVEKERRTADPNQALLGHARVLTSLPWQPTSSVLASLFSRVMLGRSCP